MVEYRTTTLRRLLIGAEIMIVLGFIGTVIKLVINGEKRYLTLCESSDQFKLIEWYLSVQLGSQLPI